MIKTLAKSIREYKKASILTPTMVSLEVILEVLIPFITADLITYMQTNGENMELSRIAIYGVILVVMAMVSLLTGMLSGKFCATASTGFAKNLRHDMYYRIQQFSFENIDKFSTSSLITRMTTDVTNVQMAYMMIIRIAIRTPLMLVCCLVMTFVVNVYIAVIYLVMAPLMGLALMLIAFKVKPIFTKVFKKYDAMNESVQENVRAARVVKAYVREDYEKEKFGKKADDIKKDFMRAEKILALNSPIMQFAIYAFMLVIAILGALLVVNSHNGTVNTTFGTLEVGDISSLISYAFMMLQSLMMIAMIAVMVSMAVTSAQRITEVLNEESTLHDPENPVHEVKDGSVRFDNVSFSYVNDPEKLSLFDIDLTIPSGSTVGILGSTGSSKSTLVQLIPRLYDATLGNVYVGGRNVKEYDLDSLRNSVAMVLQKNTLFSGTIKENMRWGDLNATDEEIEAACKQAQADSFIQTFPKKYDTYIEQGGTNVSGGQRQRLCIARALLKKPKIIIFDDSTSAVDTKTDALIRKELKENIPGTTKIFIAQRISSVQDADMIIVMNGGKIAAIGKHDELMRQSSLYREIYEAQVGGKEEEETPLTKTNGKEGRDDE